MPDKTTLEYYRKIKQEESKDDNITELHKNVTGDVTWGKGVQINRPDEAAIRRMLEQAL